MRASFVLLLAACAAPRPALPLQVFAVEGSFGAVSGLVEGDGALVLFGARGATAVRAGSVAGGDGSVVAWRPGSAAVVPATDGNGRWVVAISADGKPLRLASLTSLEEIGPRFGVTAAVGVAPIDAKSVALVLPDGVAIADGAHVTRYPGRFTAAAGGSGRLVLAAQNRVEVWDLAHGSSTGYGVHDARWVGVTPRGAAVVASSSSVWIEDRDGALIRRFDGHDVRGIAVAGTRVWVATGDELAVIEDGQASRTSGAKIPADAHLAAAADGGVWVAGADKLVRYELGGGPDWDATIAPVFSRVCSRCHLPGGSADVDLSTAAAWSAERDQIRRRVVEKGTMPPPGTPFSADDRHAIERWLAR